MLENNCPNCSKKLGIFKIGSIYKLGDKRFCSIKCKNEYKNKQTEKVKGILKVKRELKSKSEKMVMLIFGIFVSIIGVVGILISIPLMLIIIGFFSAVGFGFILVCGITLILLSKYKPISCPYCKRETKILSTQDAITCKTCQKRILLY